jgi:trigger factor
MEIQIETPGGLARRVHVRIPADRVEREYKARIQRLASRARIPGFRPGKAPLKVIQQQYGESARAEVIGELVRETWPEAMSQAQLQPAGAPDFQLAPQQPGEAFAYIASFEVYPEVQLTAPESIQVTQPVVEVTEADVDRLVDNLRRARRSWNEVQRPAQTGDQVQLDFVGRVDGAEFAGGKGEGVDVELGAGRFLPDLENAVGGHGAGEHFDADVRFPDDYPSADLRGKTAQFAVTVRAVREPVLPPIDAEFLQSHGLTEADGEAGLRNKCRQALETERDRALRERLKQQVFGELLRLHPIAVPEALVASETERMRQEAAQQFNAERAPQLKPEKLQQMLPDALFAPQARQRVALGLLMREALRQRSIEPDQARVDTALDEIAADYEEPDEVRNHYRSNLRLMQGLEATVVEQQLVEALLAGAQITEQPMSLQDLLSPPPLNPPPQAQAT